MPHSFDRPCTCSTCIRRERDRMDRETSRTRHDDGAADGSCTCSGCRAKRAHYHGASPQPCYKSGGSHDSSPRTCQCNDCFDSRRHRTRRDWARDDEGREVEHDYHDDSLTPGMTIQVGVAGSYFEWRQKLITTRHDDGTDPWLLARMLECVTPDVPDMGPGGDLARANQVADEQAEHRLQQVAGIPGPVTKPARSGSQTLAVTGATLMLGSFMLMTLALIALFTRHYDLSFMFDGLFIVASQTGQRLIVKALKRKEQQQ